MKGRIPLMVAALALMACALTGMAVAEEPAETRWRIAHSTLAPGAAGSFSEISVKAARNWLLTGGP